MDDPAGRIVDSNHQLMIINMQFPAGGGEGERPYEMGV